MRYKALRALHYIDEDGNDRFVREGDFVTHASEGKIRDLLNEGFVKESRSKSEGDES